MICQKIMLKKASISIFIIILLLFSGLQRLYADPPPDIVAESALVMEYETGRVLWEKNSQKKMFPASTTKMLTAIVAIENISNFNQIIEISENAAGRNHSAFWFRRGDRISLLDLLKAALISSHNNATIALAEYVAGSEEEFVRMMNSKARQIGAENTYFQNTNGLDSNYLLHMSTAKDLAVIARYCLKDPLFRQIVNTPRDTITVNDEEVNLRNTNSLLPISYIKGIKTGYTANAGFCIVIHSDTEELDLVTVILNSTADYRETDALMITDYVNSNFAYYQIIEKDTKTDTISIGNSNMINIDLYPQSDYVELINVSEDLVEVKYDIEQDLSLPLEKNQELGSLSVYINDEFSAEFPLISRESVSMPQVDQYLSSHREEQDRKILFFLFGFYFFIFISIMIKNLFLRKKIYV